jgi:NlpC/P60 family putative phage cell wall peptidase
MTVSRTKIVQEARLWIGTPYRHQQSVRGSGCDCLGLVRGVWRGVIGPEPRKPPPYTASWSAETKREMMMEAADQYLVRRDHQTLRSGAPFRDGDVVLLRIVSSGPAQHACITVAPDKIIHAWEMRTEVYQTQFPAGWRHYIAALYSFPGVA